ncbi:serine/threonine-protein phosphatase [Pseudomaricurvus alkylphenolicus]|uniref:PP2C family protein-serine/threonine phosphatase n=1 Tax=Pseudomaricurvus alkylphenolicus TaxID=1306991 RepID=UPI00142187AE|nr:protein phosphatase 2C domain-containing protein [Pseudomaricurvus alkylphenolicus]NIB44554.1 serine/threonine-protein phosphatase [Pseudomaricurvus alkylphenolicus]
MPTSLQSYSITDKGLLRDNNEDCYLSVPGAGLWAVADGMGGHEAGEVASAIVRETLQRHAHNSESLEKAILRSHREVLKAVDRGEGAKGMGSTVVALCSQGMDYQVSWVGDSRAYLWTAEGDGGRLELLTTDHSYVQLLLASGAITAEEMETHPDKNIITQCIGSTENAEITVDSIKGQWQKQQWLILCSDGLTDEVDNGAMAQILCRAENPREAGQLLLQEALNNGGRDNVTVQVVESPLFTRAGDGPLPQWVPGVTGHHWVDVTLYSLALLSVMLICYWTLL